MVLDRTGKGVPKVASCIDMMQTVNLTLAGIYKNSFGARMYEFEHISRSYRYLYTTTQLRFYAERLEDEFKSTGRIDPFGFHEWL
jgi:hypothetical protein